MSYHNFWLLLILVINIFYIFELLPHAQSLLLQVDEIVNISCPLRGRYQKAHSGLKRCLKLSMTDGVQRVFGMEYRPIKDLEVLAPAGLKVSLQLLYLFACRLALHLLKVSSRLTFTTYLVKLWRGNMLNWPTNGCSLPKTWWLNTKSFGLNCNYIVGELWTWCQLVVVLIQMFKKDVSYWSAIGYHITVTTLFPLHSRTYSSSNFK